MSDELTDEQRAAATAAGGCRERQSFPEVLWRGDGVQGGYGLYRIVCTALSALDRTPVVIYEPASVRGGERWMLPADDFHDGRFREVVWQAPVAL